LTRTGSYQGGNKLCVIISYITITAEKSDGTPFDGIIKIEFIESQSIREAIYKPIAQILKIKSSSDFSEFSAIARLKNKFVPNFKNGLISPEIDITLGELFNEFSNFPMSVTVRLAPNIRTNVTKISAPKRTISVFAKLDDKINEIIIPEGSVFQDIKPMVLKSFGLFSRCYLFKNEHVEFEPWDEVTPQSSSPNKPIIVRTKLGDIIDVKIRYLNADFKYYLFLGCTAKEIFKAVCNSTGVSEEMVSSPQCRMFYCDKNWQPIADIQSLQIFDGKSTKILLINDAPLPIQSIKFGCYTFESTELKEELTVQIRDPDPNQVIKEFKNYQSRTFRNLRLKETDVEPKWIVDKFGSMFRRYMNLENISESLKSKDLRASLTIKRNNGLIETELHWERKNLQRNNLSNNLITLFFSQKRVCIINKKEIVLKDVFM
jgi:hypothetical protein